MGKAILAAFFVVLLSFSFVVLHLLLKRPAGVAAAARSVPALQTRDDGSLYAVSLELEKFERRLMEEEKRSARLLGELETLRKEREEVQARVESLQGEVRRLRRQVNDGSRPPAAAEGGSPSELPETQPAPPAPAGGGTGQPPVTPPP